MHACAGEGAGGKAQGARARRGGGSEARAARRCRGPEQRQPARRRRDDARAAARRPARLPPPLAPQLDLQLVVQHAATDRRGQLFVCHFKSDYVPISVRYLTWIIQCHRGQLASEFYAPRFSLDHECDDVSLNIQ